MNATKLVLLLVIGVLCGNVSARVFIDVSKEISSISKTATRGIGAQLDVTSSTSIFNSDYGSTFVSSGPSTASGFGGSSSSTGAVVTAQGPSPTTASTSSGSSGQASATGAASPSGAIASGSGSTDGASNGSGSTGPPEVVKR